MQQGTYFLENEDAGTGQDTGRKKESRGHSHPGDSRGRDKSGHEMKATE
jgi:hypothetical protein